MHKIYISMVPFYTEGRIVLSFKSGLPCDRMVKKMEDEMICKSRHCDDVVDVLSRMAEDAWSELMIRKMRDYLDKKQGKQMDKAAKMMIDYSVEYWRAKLNGKILDEAVEEAYEAKIKNALGE